MQASTGRCAQGCLFDLDVLLAAGVEEHFGAAPQQAEDGQQAAQGAVQQAAPKQKKKKKARAAYRPRGYGGYVPKPDIEIIEL